jgi:hypothetical protein
VGPEGTFAETDGGLAHDHGLPLLVDSTFTLALVTGQSVIDVDVDYAPSEDPIEAMSLLAAAIVAGTFYFLGQGGELVFDEPEWPFIVLGALGFAALAVAVWGLRPLVSGRSGQWGWRPCARLRALARVGALPYYLAYLLGDRPGSSALARRGVGRFSRRRRFGLRSRAG